MNEGEQLHKKIMELMEGRRKFDSRGNRLPEDLTYGHAFNIVVNENPELARQYADEMRPPRERTLKEKTDPKLILTRLDTLITEKMQENTEMTFSEAFREVQREEPDLVSEYIADFLGR